VCAFVPVESVIAPMNNEVGNLLPTLRQRDALAGEWTQFASPAGRTRRETFSC
jgi:hypothetical protein